MVSAINIYGASTYSVIGSGATIYVVPSEPLNLTYNSALSNATQVSFTWT